MKSLQIEKLVFDTYEIIETDAINKKTIVMDKQKVHYTLPFSLEGYNSPIELTKLQNKIGEQEFSLKSLKDSKYQLGKTYLFKIKAHKTTKFGQTDKEIWELEDENKNEFIAFVRQVDTYNHSIGQEVKCRVVKIYPHKVFLKFIPKENFYFVPEIEYRFKLVDIKKPIGIRKDLCVLLIKDDHGSHFEVLGPSWQKKHKNEITEIHCIKAEGEKKLIQVFSKHQHPFFEPHQAYEFVIKWDIEQNENKIVVQGPDRCFYVINRPFIFYNKSLPTDSKIKLVYRGLNESFGNIKTKYFVTFEDIIPNFRALKRITFDAFRKELREGDEESLLYKLFADYDSYENLWVISFCEVLRRKMESSLKEKDFETALIFIDVLLRTEEWILNSGFLTSFSSSKRELTSKVAFVELDTLKKEYKALELILDGKEEDFVANFSVPNLNQLPIDKDLVENLHILLFVFKHKKFDESNPLQRFLNTIFFLGRKEFFKTEKTASTTALEILEEIKSFFEKKLFYGVFINSEKRRNYFANNSDLLDYISVTFAGLLINLDLENRKSVVCLSIRLSKLVSLFENDSDKQYKIIRSALSLSTAKIDFVIEQAKATFSWNDHIGRKFVLEKALLGTKNKSFKNIEEIKKSFSEASFLRVRVTGNSWIGYEVNYKEDSLFLPFFNAQRPFKKGESLDVIVYQLDEEFSHALVKTVIGINELPEDQTIERGVNIKGIVKRVEDYGVFVNLGSQDGLIPKREITNQYISHPEDILNIGDVIESKVLSIDKDGEVTKITLSRREYLKDKIKTISLESKKYEAIITNIVEAHGIFIEVSTGHSGLIRREEILWNDVDYISDIFSSGERVTVEFLYSSKDKNFFSLIANKVDPFTRNDLINKTFTARVIGFSDFDQWLEFYSIDTKFQISSKENALLTYCPFCYEKSPFRAVAYRKLTDERSIVVPDNRKSWKCTNCNFSAHEALHFYIPDIQIVASFDLNLLSQRDYTKVRKTIHKKDLVNLTISKISKRFRDVEVQLDLASFKKGNLQTKYTIIEKIVGYEIAGCYEQYAFQLDDFDQRINYLDWAKYYYGVSKSAKSYYLGAYVNYINLVSSIISGDKLREDTSEVIERCKRLISEIELQTSIIESFPVIEKIILLLKVISNLKSKTEEAYTFLLNISMSEGEKEHDYIKNLAAAILSYNLIDEDSSSLLVESLKERIVLLMKRSLSSFSESELDSEELNKRMFIEKLLTNGEDSNVEFKATLDVPVLNKEQKSSISVEKLKLENTTDENEKKVILKRIQELANVNPSDRKMIDIVNLSAIKTIAAFANTAGGHFVIGIDEDEFGNPYVLGIDADLKKHKNKDGIRLRLDGLFQKYFGNGMINSLIKSLDFVSCRGKEVILIEVNKCNSEVFVSTSDEKKFYIRRQASTAELKSFEFYEYMKAREI